MRAWVLFVVLLGCDGLERPPAWLEPFCEEQKERIERETGVELEARGRLGHCSDRELGGDCRQWACGFGVLVSFVERTPPECRIVVEADDEGVGGVPAPPEPVVEQMLVLSCPADGPGGAGGAGGSVEADGGGDDASAGGAGGAA